MWKEWRRLGHVTHLNDTALLCEPCPTSLRFPPGAARSFADEPPGLLFFGIPLSCLLDLPRSLFFIYCWHFHLRWPLLCPCAAGVGPITSVTLLFASHCAKGWNTNLVCPDADAHEWTSEISTSLGMAHPSTQCVLVIIRSKEAHETLQISRNEFHKYDFPSRKQGKRIFTWHVLWAKHHALCRRYVTWPWKPSTREFYTPFYTWGFW